jgi:hypothetical protein
MHRTPSTDSCVEKRAPSPHRRSNTLPTRTYRGTKSGAAGRWLVSPPADNCYNAGFPGAAREVRTRLPFPLTDPAGESTCRGPHRGSNSVVECNLAKVDVEGSNPFSRSEHRLNRPVRGAALAGFFVQWATKIREGATNGATNPPADEFAPPFPKSWITCRRSRAARRVRPSSSGVASPPWRGQR